MARYRLGHFEAVTELVEGMQKRGVQPSRLIYNLGISAHAQLDHADGAMQLFERMCDAGAHGSKHPPSEVCVGVSVCVYVRACVCV